MVGKSDVTVAVTSDRGLCGGLNSNITKYTKALLRLDSAGAGWELWGAIAGPVGWQLLPHRLFRAAMDGCYDG